MGIGNQHGKIKEYEGLVATAYISPKAGKYLQCIVANANDGIIEELPQVMYSANHLQCMCTL